MTSITCFHDDNPSFLTPRISTSSGAVRADLTASKRGHLINASSAYSSNQQSASGVGSVPSVTTHGNTARAASARSISPVAKRQKASSKLCAAASASSHPLGHRCRLCRLPATTVAYNNTRTASALIAARLTYDNRLRPLAQGKERSDRRLFVFAVQRASYRPGLTNTSDCQTREISF
jgi:hypothetical protein